MIKCLSYAGAKGIKAVVVGPDSSETENKEASEGKYNLVFTSPEALICLLVIGPRFSHWRTKSKLYSLMKGIVWRNGYSGRFYSFHVYIVRKLSVILLFVQLLFFCVKFAFVVFHGFLADISQLYTCKYWSSAVLCKSNESEIEIRPFANTAVISSGSKNSGFGNSRKISRTVYFTYDASMTS